MLEALHKLTSPALRELASALADGPMSAGVTTHSVQQIAGATMTAELLACLNGLTDTGWKPKQIAVLAASIVAARDRAAQADDLLDLVLSGPEVAGIPTRDTAAVMHTLVEQAQQEVLLVGYAVHNGRKLFERLAERMAAKPDLKVWFCLNIQRRPTDTSLSSEIVRRFGHEFVTKHWPWAPKPDLYYDPRALDAGRGKQTSLHAKCLIVDRREALITSANFTEAAQERNIEVGVVVRHAPLVTRLATYCEALRASVLKPCLLSES